MGVCDKRFIVGESTVELWFEVCLPQTHRATTATCLFMSSLSGLQLKLLYVSADVCYTSPIGDILRPFGFNVFSPPHLARSQESEFVSAKNPKPLAKTLKPVKEHSRLQRRAIDSPNVDRVVGAQRMVPGVI